MQILKIATLLIFIFGCKKNQDLSRKYNLYFESIKPNCQYINNFTYYSSLDSTNVLNINLNLPIKLFKKDKKDPKISEFGLLFTCHDSTSTHSLKFYYDYRRKDSIIQEYIRTFLNNDEMIYAQDKGLLIEKYYSPIDTTRGVVYSHGHTDYKNGVPIYESTVMIYPSKKNIDYYFYIRVDSKTKHVGELNIENLDIVKCILASWDVKIQGEISANLNL